MRARLEMDLWYPRDPEIIPEPLIINAACAVILFKPKIAAQKILSGMLSVLELPRKEYMIVRINSDKPDLEKINKKLQLWQPMTILQLSMELPVVTHAGNVVITFSPEHLQDNPQDKARAYKDLLSLRNILHHGTANRHT